jgi:hypothetical protein
MPGRAFGAEGEFRMFGGIGYSDGHPSRWAGVTSGGTAVLALDRDRVVITPLWPWRVLSRMPTLSIPLDKIAAVFEIHGGLQFSVPGDAALDGTRFRRWWGGAERLEELLDLLAGRDRGSFA